MGWSDKYKKSIDCNNPKGFSQRAHCQGKKKKMNEDLRKWFGKGGEGGVGGGGWDRYNTKGERIGKCARGEGEGKPKCLSKEKAAKMSKKEIAAAVRRKRKSDPVADRPGKGGKPKMVSNKIDEKKKNDDPCWIGYKQVGMKKKGNKMVPNCVKEEDLQEKNKPTNPKLWAKWKSKAKAKFDVYPSAYANGWAAKGYKSEGGGWKTVSEERDHEYSMVRSQLSTIMNAAKRLKEKMKGEGNVEAWVQSKITKASDYLDSAADYVDSGEMNVENITFTAFRESIDKSKMKCNKPKAQAVGDSKTGKSHVVKACKDGEEKIIRFGQRGVKGSPKKEGESEKYASRRKAFKDRHAKNIAKGKMSAAYWANKVKW